MRQTTKVQDKTNPDFGLLFSKERKSVPPIFLFFSPMQSKTHQNRLLTIIPPYVYVQNPFLQCCSDSCDVTAFPKLESTGSTQTAHSIGY
jgi:hypothetical protein